MTYKIGFTGAPGSGKTTLSANLFAQMLLQGHAHTHLVMEYAREFLAKGRNIEDLEDQRFITETQLERERSAEFTNFDVLKSHKNVVKAPKSLKARDNFVKYIANHIIEMRCELVTGYDPS